MQAVGNPHISPVICINEQHGSISKLLENNNTTRGLQDKQLYQLDYYYYYFRIPYTDQPRFILHLVCRRSGNCMFLKNYHYCK